MEKYPDIFRQQYFEDIKTNVGDHQNLDHISYISVLSYWLIDNNTSGGEEDFLDSEDQNLIKSI